MSAALPKEELLRREGRLRLGQDLVAKTVYPSFLGLKPYTTVFIRIPCFLFLYSNGSDSQHGLSKILLHQRFFQRLQLFEALLHCQF